MFYNVDSGLYLTRCRAYDPVSGRWLSRDPDGEQIMPIEINPSVDSLHCSISATPTEPDRAHYYGRSRLDSEDPLAFQWGGNLYEYVGGNPLSRDDLKGDQWGQVIIGILAMGGIIMEGYDYYSHPPPLTPVPPPVAPGNQCTPQYPRGAPPPSVSAGSPSSTPEQPEYSEPPDAHELPEILE
jgi:hypothetical protein